MIPGSNLLKTALSVIATQTISYLRYSGRTLNAARQEVPTYQAAINLKGSLQPVPRHRYEQFGLNLQKSYYTFYASADVIDLARATAGDKFTYDGKTFQVESNNDWYAVDGWKGILACQINVATP